MILSGTGTFHTEMNIAPRGYCTRRSYLGKAVEYLTASGSVYAKEDEHEAHELL